MSYSAFVNLSERLLLTMLDYLTKTRLYHQISATFWGSKAKVLQEEDTKVALPLVEKIVLSYNTRIFRFRLPSDYHVLGLSPGQHVYLSAKIDEKLVVRPYTPVSTDDEPGYVDLIVKVYFAGVHPQFPEGGKMSQHLDKLKIGDTIDFRGPNGHVIYRGTGLFAVKAEKKGLPHTERNAKKISMIAGGSGITPMLQILKAIVKNESDPTTVKFIFANVAEEDILCRKEIETLVEKSKGKVEVWYVLSKPPAGWKFSVGHVNEEIFKEKLFPPAEDNLVLLCGPPRMISDACKPALEKIGHSTKNVLVF